MQVEWIDLESCERLATILHEARVLVSGAWVKDLASAGEGNMNVTLRATVQAESETATEGSIIVKQSRPFVAKYEQIAAPLNRIEHEAAFYRITQHIPAVSERMPRLLGWIPDHYLLVLEDLGPATDATSLYRECPKDFQTSLGPLVGWLAQLHGQSRGLSERLDGNNLELRKLNHAHIFDLPFQDPAILPLDEVCPGLADATRSIRKNAALRKKCRELGALYLSDGECLLHGDFYPGSWLLSAKGPRVIDPEFCFRGPAEFDLGVLTGHLQLMAGEIDAAFVRSTYENAIQGIADETALKIDWGLANELGAVEVLRRLLGVAQLPLALSLEERVDLIDDACNTLI